MVALAVCGANRRPQPREPTTDLAYATGATRAVAAGWGWSNRDVRHGMTLAWSARRALHVRNGMLARITDIPIVTDIVSLGPARDAPAPRAHDESGRTCVPRWTWREL